MKVIWFFALVVCSFPYISVSSAEENSLLSSSVCKEQVNTMFSRGFENVTRRVIEGPQYITYTVGHTNV